MTSERPRVLYVGPHAEPVRATAEAVGAEFASCLHPEDAVALLRAVPADVILLHTPDATAWLPMLRSNHPTGVYVLLAVPQQMTIEQTHPWVLVDDRLDLPLERWLEQESKSDPDSLSVPMGVLESTRRRWILLTLDAKGGLTRAYGWTHYTGQAEAEALGFGWLEMVEDPEAWRAALASRDHVHVELGVFSWESGVHHRCLARCVRTTGWTVHIDDRQGEVTRAERLVQLEREALELRNEQANLARTVVSLETRLADERQRRVQLLETLGDVASATARMEQLRRVVYQLHASADSMAVLRGAPDRRTRQAALDAVAQGLRVASSSLERHLSDLELSAKPLVVTSVRVDALFDTTGWAGAPIEGPGGSLVEVDASLFRAALSGIVAEERDRNQRAVSVQHDGQVVYVSVRPVYGEALGGLRSVVVRHGGTFGVPVSPKAEQGVAWFGLPAAAAFDGSGPRDPIA